MVARVLPSAEIDIRPRTYINGHLSDLFFNLNTDDIECPRGRNDVFQGYDDDKLLEKARWFLGTMDSCGCPNLPTAQELVDDFKARL